MTAKILIADDERAITEGLSAILRDEGYDTEIASDGQLAATANGRASSKGGHACLPPTARQRSRR